MLFRVKIEFVHSIAFRIFAFQFVTCRFRWGHALFTTTRDLKNIIGCHTLFGLNGDSTKF